MLDWLLTTSLKAANQTADVFMWVLAFNSAVHRERIIDSVLTAPVWFPDTCVAAELADCTDCTRFFVHHFCHGTLGQSDRWSLPAEGRCAVFCQQTTEEPHNTLLFQTAVERSVKPRSRRPYKEGWVGRFAPFTYGCASTASSDETPRHLPIGESRGRFRSSLVNSRLSCRIFLVPRLM